MTIQQALAGTGALAIALFAATATAQQTGDGLSFEQGGTGTITFQGQVTAATCSVASGQEDQTVVLPSVQIADFETMGDTAGATPFTINLTNCAAGMSDDTAVTAYFLNGTNVNEEGRLINNGTAKDVSIQLSGSQDAPINIGSGAGMTDSALGNLPEADLSDGTTTLNYQARYYAENDSVGAGSVQTSVEYVLRYR